MARQNFGSTIGPVNYTASNNLTNNPFYNYNKNTIIGGSKSFDKNKKSLLNNKMINIHLEVKQIIKKTDLNI